MFTRFALGFGYLIFLLLVGLIVLGVHFMSGTVPSYTGTATVAGIGASVDIDRDEYAIPHIHAATERDAYFGLGYAEAQDRLFQMELERRLGAGRMSELFGAQSLTLDEWTRTIGFSRIADQMWLNAGPHTREVLTAFCSGINAYLHEHRTHLGFEFDALGLAPEDWRPQDCLIIGRLMAWEMNFSALTDAAYSDFSLAVDSARLRSLFPYYPTDGATVLGGGNPSMFVSNYLSAPPKVSVSVAHESSRAERIVVEHPALPPKPASTQPAKPKASTKPQTKPQAKPQSKPQAKPQSKPSIKPPKPHIPKPMQRIGMSRLLHSEYAAIFRNGCVFDSAVGAFLGGGSNSFAIAPSRTASGAALLENDTHLQLGAPSRWYMAHLTSDDGLNVAGFLIPGLPVILSGRSPDLAWGVTSGMADECDYFVEKLDSTGTQYLRANGTSQKFQIIHDTIRVRDTTRASDNSTVDPLRIVPFDVRLTVHGPVMSMHPDSLARSFHSDERAGGIPSNSIFNQADRPVAMMWNGTYALTDELAGWLDLPRATSAAQARNGMGGFAAPCLNLCLADTKGNISYQYIGRLPRRAGSEARLLLPRDGMNPADQWQGFIYMRDLPSVTDPSRGYIVSANNPPGTMGSGGSIAYGLDWEPSSRADRINELIQTSKTKLDAAAVQSIQTDIISPYDLRRVLPYLLNLYPNPNPPSIAPDSTSAFRLDSMRLYWKEDSLRSHTNITDSAMKLVRSTDSVWLAMHRPQNEIPPPLEEGKVRVVDPFTAQVLTYLRNWDGGMRPEEIAPAIYSVFLNRLLFNTFRTGLGAQCYAEFIYLDNISLQTLANILPDSSNVWWHQGALASSQVSGRDAIILTSFRESLRILALTFGRDIRQWQWGRLHTLTFRHPFDRASKLVARLVDIPAGAMPGGPTTVLQGTYYLWDPYKMQIGPSMRMVTDLKEPVLYGVLPTGNSEAIFGDHYKDMLPLYQSGALVRVSLTDHNPNWKRFELRPQGE